MKTAVIKNGGISTGLKSVIYGLFGRLPLVPKRETTHEEVVSATTKRKTDREFILSYLQSGHTLTTVEARNLFGIQAVATRVFELRKQGYEIFTEFVKTASGEHIARYTMAKVVS